MLLLTAPRQVMTIKKSRRGAKQSRLLCHKKQKEKTFIAQGSEKGFGLPYAFGINDSALMKNQDSYVQVVSCNTHNICSLVKTLSAGDVKRTL